MPANLPPVYHEAEARYRSAKSPQEKITALEEMLRLVPKHKGTEKLQGDLKARLAKLRKQPDKKGGKGFSRHVAHQGAGQIALVGPPNGGKSALVDQLTHATPEVAPYPGTTREPLPGMMPFENVAFQLVDLPPICEEHVEPWVFDLIRGADLAWLVVDGGNSLDGLESCRRLLADKHIDVLPAGEQPQEGRAAGWTPLPTLVVVTRRDRPGSAENLEILRELLVEAWPLLSVSPLDGQGLDELGRATFDALGIMRVYTKQPSKPPDREQPFTLPLGATVHELARLIHKDMEQQFRFARIWGASAFDGQTVQGEHVLAEGDVVEIHV